VESNDTATWVSLCYTVSEMLFLPVIDLTLCFPNLFVNPLDLLELGKRRFVEP
jgi:hypothetical protein